MSGILNALLAMLGGIVKNFTTWTVSADSPPGTLASATFSVNADGSISYIAANNDFSTPGSLNWFRPTTPGIGSNYWVRFTPTVGTLTTNSAATFTQLNVARNVTKSASSGAANCTFTIDIAADSGGTNIVFTSAGNIIGYTHT